jgi:hypothetical protein
MTAPDLNDRGQCALWETQCLKWVRLGHLGDLPLRPLHPWERTSSASLTSSEKCHKRSSPSVWSAIDVD